MRLSPTPHLIQRRGLPPNECVRLRDGARLANEWLCCLHIEPGARVVVDAFTVVVTLISTREPSCGCGEHCGCAHDYN